MDTHIVIDFALSCDTSRMVGIGEVKRGLACNCVCPECGRAMVARKGRKRRHGFAHYGSSDGSGASAACGETALHRMASEILAGFELIQLPPLLVEEGASIGGRQLTVSRAAPAREFVVARSELCDRNQKSWKGGWRPDVCLWNDQGESVCLEVLVSNPVRAEKQEKISMDCLDTLEFDLSSFRHCEGWNRQSLTMALKTDSSIARWAFHRDEARLRAEINVEIEERQSASRLRTSRIGEKKPDLRDDVAAKKNQQGIPSRDASAFIPPPGADGSEDTELVFHPWYGLIPRDPAKRQAYVEAQFGRPEIFELPGATVYLRSHPLDQDSCVVAFAPKEAGGSVANHEADLSEFAEEQGLRCIYYGVENFRMVRGHGVHGEVAGYFRLKWPPSSRQESV